MARAAKSTIATKEKSDRLYRAILTLKTEEECYNFFQDLCTISELRSMEQRYEVAALLDRYGVAVRAGWHCAGAAHRRFGTLEHGTVRLAPSAYTTAESADKVSKLFLQIAEKKLH